MITAQTKYRFIAAVRAAKLDFHYYINEKRARKAHPKYLHIGCGKVIKPGWTNIDIIPQADLQYDVRRGLPFKDACCEMIYSEHFLEHLEWPKESIPFLKECFRVLKAGGIISIGVPDSQYVVETCLHDLQRFRTIVQENNWGYPNYCHTAYEYINYHFRIEGSHKFAYDEETLKTHLEQIGFIQVNRREFQSNLDSQNRALGTLYMDGTKP